MTPLTPRQQRFVAEFLVDLNATRAAQAAGYSAKTARQAGSRLLTNIDVSAAVAAGQAVHLDRLALTKQRVLQEYARIAFLDPRRFWQKTVVTRIAFGVPLLETVVRLKDVTELDDDDAAALASFEAVIKNGAAGDGVTDVPRAQEGRGRAWSLPVERQSPLLRPPWLGAHRSIQRADAAVVQHTRGQTRLPPG
jgi:hypothetical protein